MKTLQANYFLAPEDENLLSQHVRRHYAALAFVDDQLWDTSVPPARGSITECSSGLAYLWWRDIVPTLPSTIQSTGKFRGPTTGCVLQFCRCRLRNDELYVGQMRIYESAFEAVILERIKEVFRTMRSLFDLRDGFLVGPHAVRLSTAGVRMRVNAQSYLSQK